MDKPTPHKLPNVFDDPLLRHTQGCMEGVIIGDALGMPFETMKADEIRKAIGSDHIRVFHEPFQTRIKDTRGLKKGSSTDDSQLTQVVAESLIACNGHLDPDDCAQRHIKALETTTFGWGGTTENSIKAIRAGLRQVNPGFSYLVPCIPSQKRIGSGNGVVMKIAPLAIVHSLAFGHITGGMDWHDRLWNECVSLGMMTHGDMRATIAAYAVALCISYSIQNRIKDKAEMDRLLQLVIFAIEDIELRFYIPYMRMDRAVADGLESIRANYAGNGKLEDAMKSPGFHAFGALETACLSIGLFARHWNDFPAGLSAAVMLGGDTDTNASIVGALIGAQVGIGGIPDEWRTFNPDFRKFGELADGLAVAARSLKISEGV